MKKILVKTGLFLIVISLGLLGAKLTQSPKVKEDLMVHDYVIEYAVQFCAPHQGLHYIVPLPTESYRTSYDTDCSDLYRIRCQDDYLFEFNTGASGGCFTGVSHMQWDETMKQKNGEYHHL